MITNPGFPVALRAENNLRLAAYWLRLQVKVGRAVTPALVVLNTIRTIRDLRDSDITYSAPTEYPVINDKDWPRTIKSIVEFLGTFLGETKIPLAYVIRETVELLDVADTPADYASVGEEMTTSVVGLPLMLKTSWRMPSRLTRWMSYVCSNTRRLRIFAR